MIKEILAGIVTYSIFAGIVTASFIVATGGF